MAKEKKKLMIPFSYYHEQILDWCRYYYEEGTINSDTMVWDTVNNKQVIAPWKPSETIGWERLPNLNYEKEHEEYLVKLNEYQHKLELGEYITVDKITWKANFEFEDTLRLTGMSRGRSAANFNLKSETTGKNYNVFMTDMVDLFQNATINKGSVTGKWTFVKRGHNYGIKLIV